MGNLSDIQKGQIVGARLGGASLTKTVTSLGVSRATVLTVRTTHIIGRRHQLGENNGLKPTFNENDRLTFVSKLKRVATIRKTY